MADDTQSRLTGKAARDAFGWPLIVFGSLLVSGPGVLAVLQEIFVEYRLAPLFQRVLDTWNQILAILAGPIEPPVRALLAWINGLFGWSLTLGKHWRPLFMLGMVLVGAWLRNAWRRGDWKQSLQVVALGLGLLVFALAAGLVALGGVARPGGEGAHGLALGLLLGGLGLVVGLAEGNGLGASLGAGAIGFALGFVFAASLALAPGSIGDGAALLALGAFILLLGGWGLQDGLRNRNDTFIFIGLAMLGGFAVAAVVMIADVGLKLLA